MNCYNNLKVGAKIIAGYIVVLALMIITTTVLLFKMTSLTNGFAFLVEHDQPVLANAARLEKLVVDMETGERGFLITGQEEFLEPYNNGLTEFARLLEIEKVLVSDNPAQVAALEEIERLHHEWIRLAAKPEIAKRREANKASVSAENLQEILKIGVGKGILDELRRELDKMEADFRANGDLESTVLTVTLLKDMVDQETGQRGFLITGDNTFLEPYKKGKTQVVADIASLRRRLARDAVNLTWLDRVESLAADWMKKAAEPEINARLEMNANSVTGRDVAALIEAGTGKSILDQMRTKFATFTRTENILNAQRSEEAKQQVTLYRFLTISLTLASIVIGLFLSFYISRGITNSLGEVAEASTRVAAGDLNMSVEVSSRDEVGSLATAFNEMTTSLRHTSEELKREINDRKKAEEALKGAHDQLERRVQERTSELAETNATLRTEITERKRTERELQESEAAVRKSQEHLRILAGRLISAQEDERHRLARELHHDLTQRLAVLAIDAGILEQHSDSCPDLIREKLPEMKEEIMKLSADIHRISRQLHPSILDDLGLVDAIKSFCTGFSNREGLSVEFTPENLPEVLPKDLSLCLYRITQESLRNVAKHARAKEAHVTLAGNGGDVLLSIQDSGVGFDLAQVRGNPGLGLTSMEERVRLIQGSLSVQSQPTQGTTIEVRAPLSRGDG